jgi:SecD/SecF fusion protein
MRKFYSTIIVLLILFFYNCAGNKDKAEITIRLSEAEFLYKLTNYTNDSNFISAYKFANSNYNPEKEEFVDVLVKKLLELNPEISLASIYSTFELKDKVNYTTTNEELITILKEECKLAKEKTLQVLKKRVESSISESSFISRIINKPEVIIQELSEKNSYLFTINRKADVNRFTELFQEKADFGFWETYDNKEIFEYLNSANTKLKEYSDTEGIEKVNDTDAEDADSENDNPLMAQNEIDTSIFVIENPLFTILKPSVSNEGQLRDGSEIGISAIKDTAMVNKYLNIEDIQNIFPRNLKMMWTLKPIYGSDKYISLVAVKITSMDGRPPISNEYVVEASSKESNFGSVVSIKMNAEGAQIWSRMTKENIGRQIAIVLNNAVYSYPTVQSEITGGNSEISGDFTLEEATDLAALLNAGTMPNITVKVVKMNN